MRPLSGPSEAHRAKNGKFTQSYRPIVGAGRQSITETQFIPQDPLHSRARALDLGTLRSSTSGNSRKQYRTD